MVIRLLIIFWTAISAGHSARPFQDLVSVTMDEVTLRPGKKNAVVLWIDVKEGYHIQANDVDDESLIPTSLKIDGGENVITVKQMFPRAKTFRLEGTDIFLKVYDGKFRVKVLLTPAAQAKAGKYSLPARIQYQACDSRSCLFPRVIEFSIPAEINVH